MSEFDAFLNPQRAENERFVLSGDFKDADGKALIWEMRKLSAAEGLEIEQRYVSKGETEVMLAMVAASLVSPDLSDERLLKELSDKTGSVILSPVQAIKAMVNMAELIKLVEIYCRYNELDVSAEKLVEKAKN